MTEAQASVSRFNEIFDANLELHSKAAAATANTAVTGDKGILDLGAGEWWGQLVVDVQAMSVATGDSYVIALQGSDSASFAGATHREIACLRLGDVAAFGEGADSAAGVQRYKVPCCNFKGANGPFRYVRLRITATGATSSIDLNAFLSALNG